MTDKWDQAINEVVEEARREAIDAACEILNRRANGYAARGTAIFNGKIMADELRGNIREIKQLTFPIG